MIIIQSYIVYLTTTFFMFVLCRHAISIKKWSPVVLACLIYGIIFGLRYGVGVDFFSYVQQYEGVDISNQINYLEIIEPGWSMLKRSLALLGLSYTSLMFVTSFFSIYFTFRILKGRSDLYPYMVLTFMILCMWLTYCNGLRQVLACSLWIWSIRYIESREPLKHYILLVIAATFHVSAILLSIFYPMLSRKNELIKSVGLQLVLILFALVLMQLGFVKMYLNHFESLMSFLGYDFYVNKGTIVRASAQEIGIGFFVNLLRMFFYIFMSDGVKKWRSDALFNISYSLFFIGVIGKYLLWDSQVLTRFIAYFMYLEPIIAAYTLAFIWRFKRRLFATYFFLLFVSIFIATIYRGEDNSAYYVFQGQETYYPIKKKFLPTDDVIY